ncbi:hypothetical protein D9758_014686 [Tetrapyrgos nigripes]|uniref:Uncharacterized protein n=1 Tax=Tetrapyrgos nigripes TaxID=182062 RepID=A0A8H5CMQ4_9AGAR|nr:hypothetical protein D9758_014686 [Tetrapyrgos nigripes]
MSKSSHHVAIPTTPRRAKILQNAAEIMVSALEPDSPAARTPVKTYKGATRCRQVDTPQASSSRLCRSESHRHVNTPQASSSRIHRSESPKYVSESEEDNVSIKSEDCSLSYSPIRSSLHSFPQSPYQCGLCGQAHLGKCKYSKYRGSA